jgi:autotransporter-associated beta strand protein
MYRSLFALRVFVFALAFVSVVGFASPCQAQTQNYFGTSGTLNGSVWSTNPAGPYTSALVTTGGAIINFGNATTAITGASIVVAGINATANATITSPAGTLSNFNNGVIPINVAAGVTLTFGSQSFTTSASAGYIFNGNGTGTLSLSGNTYGGGFTLNSGIVVVAGTNALGGGATNTLTINGGTLSANGNRVLTDKFLGGIFIGGDFTFGTAANSATLSFNNNVDLGAATRTITLGAASTYTFSGIISSATGTTGLTLAANAAGTLALTGANTYTGITTVNGGTLNLGNNTATGSLNSLSTLAVGGGGTFTFTRTGTNTQQVNGFNVNAGLGIVSNTLATNTLTLGNITRNNSGYVNFANLTGNTNTGTGNNNSIIGPWASTGSGAGLGYAVSNGAGVAISTFTGTPATAVNISNVNDPTANYDYAGAGGNIVQTVPVTANTLRITGATVTTWANGGNAITLNGLMLAGTTNLAMSGAGAINIGANNELDLVVNGQTLTVNPAIQNNGLNTSSVVVGSTNGGTVILAGASTFSGGTTLNSGTLTIGANSTPGVGTVTSGPVGTGPLTLSGGTLSANGTFTIANNIAVTGLTTTNITASAAGVFTLNGAITGTGTIQSNSSANSSLVLNGDISGFQGTLIYNNILSGNNVFFTGTGNALNGSQATFNLTGVTTTATRYLGINAGTFQMGTLTGTGGWIGPAASSAVVTLQVGALNATTTFAGIISDSSPTASVTGTLGLTKVGTGSLTLTGVNAYSGPTIVSAGTLALSGSGSFATSQTITVGTANLSTAILNVGGLTGGTNFSAGGFTLATGQTLAGHGTVNTGIIGFSAPSGTTVSPGTSAGTLKIIGTTAIAGIYNFELATAGTGFASTPTPGASSPALPHTNHDVISVTGTTNFTGQINVGSLGAGGATGFDNTKNYSWLILTSTGTLTASPSLGPISGTDFSSLGGGSFNLSADTNNIYLNFVAASVPEPTTILGLSTAGLGLINRLRRRRK